jgi:hypothetical protein
MSNLKEIIKAMLKDRSVLTRRLKHLRQESRIYQFLDDEIEELDRELKQKDKDRINIQNIVNGFPEKTIII